MHDYSGSAVFPASISLVDDADAPTAANFNTAPEGNRNAIVYLNSVRGAFRNEGSFDTAVNSSGTSYATYTSTFFDWSLAYEVQNIAASSTTAGDVLEVVVTGNLGCQIPAATLGGGWLALGIKANGATSYTQQTGSQVIFGTRNDDGALSHDFDAPFTLQSRVTITDGTAPISVAVTGKVSGATNIRLIEAYRVQTTHRRPNA